MWLYTELPLFTAHRCPVRGVAVDAINTEVYSAASDGSIGVRWRGEGGGDEGGGVRREMWDGGWRRM